MKSIKEILTTILLLSGLLAFGQGTQAPSKEIRESFCRSYDLSSFLATDEEWGMNGVFDTLYTRIQIHFDTVYRDKKNPFLYHVTGASRHMKEVTYFKGDILVTSVRQYDVEYYWAMDTGFNGLPGGGKDQKYTDITASYNLYEDSNSKYSGVFMGKLNFGLHQKPNGELVNDQPEYEGDGYSNFIYKGTWTSYVSKKPKLCSWNDGKMPIPGKDETEYRYWKNGWEKNEKERMEDEVKYWWIKPKK